MMRFPLRLAADLTKVLIAQKVFGTARYPLELRVNLAKLPAPSEFHSTRTADSPSMACSSEASTDLQVLSTVRGSAAPVVWIGGDTPLRYPRIAQITRDIVNRRRTVFIEMDGMLLRRRIHEFRPVPRLYLVLPLNGLETSHDLRAGQTGSFRATMESIRAAKLSGFLVCVQTKIFADTEKSELRRLAETILSLDVDGWIQNRPTGAQPMGVEAAQKPADKIESALNLIPSRGWRLFSGLLDLTRETDTLHFENKKAAKRVEEEVHGREEGLRVL